MLPAGNIMKIGAGIENRVGLFRVHISRPTNVNRGDFHLFENHHDYDTQ